MAKPYKRKIYLENNSRDSSKCNDIRKSINSSERLKSKQLIKKQTIQCHDNYFHQEDACMCYLCIKQAIIHEEHLRESSRYYSATYSVGGKMLQSLVKLGLIEENSIEFWDLIFSMDQYFS
jgi:hypothetical protein